MCWGNYLSINREIILISDDDVEIAHYAMQIPRRYLAWSVVCGSANLQPETSDFHEMLLSPPGFVSDGSFVGDLVSGFSCWHAWFTLKGITPRAKTSLRNYRLSHLVFHSHALMLHITGYLSHEYIHNFVVHLFAGWAILSTTKQQHAKYQETCALLLLYVM